RHFLYDSDRPCAVGGAVTVANDLKNQKAVGETQKAETDNRWLHCSVPTAHCLLLYVPFRSLALPLNRLSLHDSDRDTNSSARSISTTLNQTQIVCGCVADGVYLSNRRARDAAHVCQCFAWDLFSRR